MRYSMVGHDVWSLCRNQMDLRKKLKIAISPKLFWSFGLTSTSGKSPQSPLKSKILGPIY